jgi:hypothetical protein
MHGSSLGREVEAASIKGIDEGRASVNSTSHRSPKPLMLENRGHDAEAYYAQGASDSLSNMGPRLMTISPLLCVLDENLRWEDGVGEATNTDLLWNTL